MKAATFCATILRPEVHQRPKRPRPRSLTAAAREVIYAHVLLLKEIATQIFKLKKLADFM